MTTTNTFTAVIYAGTPGVRVHRDHLRIVGTSRAELVDAVLAQVRQGAGRIELCGGLGAEDAARVRAAVGPDVRVGLNRSSSSMADSGSRQRRPPCVPAVGGSPSGSSGTTTEPGFTAAPRYRWIPVRCS